jgi:DNA-binding PadR family transcriptional regulator
MNLERAILLTLLAAKGDALSAADIRRELPAFTRQPAALAEVENALRGLEEVKQILGSAGDREDEAGRAVTVFTLLEKGRARALK